MDDLRWQFLPLLPTSRPHPWQQGLLGEQANFGRLATGLVFPVKDEGAELHTVESQLRKISTALPQIPKSHTPLSSIILLGAYLSEAQNLAQATNLKCFATKLKAWDAPRP